MEIFTFMKRIFSLIKRYYFQCYEIDKLNFLLQDEIVLLQQTFVFKYLPLSNARE